MDKSDLISHSIKIIIMTLGIYIIVINIIDWANGYNVANNLEATNLNWNFNAFHNTTMTSFKGFKWFKEHLATFPGINQTIATLQKNANIFKNFEGVEAHDIFGYVMAIWQFITIPFTLVISLLKDIINNVLWFFTFLVNLGKR